MFQTKLKITALEKYHEKNCEKSKNLEQKNLLNTLLYFYINSYLFFPLID